MAHEELTGSLIKRLDTCISGDRKQCGRPVASRLWNRLPKDLQSALRIASEPGAYDDAFEKIRTWYAAHPNPGKLAVDVPLTKRIHDARAQLGALRVCHEQVEALWAGATFEQKMIGVQAIIDADRAAFAHQG